MREWIPAVNFPLPPDAGTALWMAEATAISSRRPPVWQSSPVSPSPRNQPLPVRASTAPSPACRYRTTIRSYRKVPRTISRLPSDFLNPTKTIS